MNRRALLIAAVVAALGVVLLVLYQRRFELDASGGERVTVLVAAKKIERGAIVQPDMLAPRKVPLAWLEDRAIKESESPKILGLPAANTVLPQQTLMWTDMLNAQDELTFVSDRVQPGSRGMTVRVDRDSSVGLIHPGDYVDVFGTFVQGEGDNGQHISKLLLQKVLVLAVGHDTARDRQTTRDESATVLTLSLSPPEVNVVSIAMTTGRINVAIRSVADQQRLDPTQLTEKEFDGVNGPRIRVARPTGPTRIE